MRALGLCGALEQHGGTTILHGTLFENSTVRAAESEGAQIFNGATLIYVLPAPPGRWLFGIVQCREIQCIDRQLCPHQPCDLDANPELDGTWLTTVSPGAIDDGSWPKPCQAGVYASGVEGRGKATAGERPGGRRRGAAARAAARRAGNRREREDARKKSNGRVTQNGAHRPPFFSARQ